MIAEVPQPDVRTHVYWIGTKELTQTVVVFISEIKPTYRFLDLGDVGAAPAHVPKQLTHNVVRIDSE